jgi:DNA-binding MurR/RpiR family transcriptional regulator
VESIADPAGDDFLRFNELLTQQLDLMPEGLRAAARFVLSHPVDVALYSMRKQATQARVSHSTMVRLAEWMGLDGYDALRSVYQHGIKAGIQAGANGASTEAGSGLPVASNSLEWLASEIERFGLQDSIQRYAEAAAILANADRVICVASGAELTVASHFRQLMHAMGRDAVSFDPVEGVPAADLKSLGSRDALLAVCTGSAILRVTSTARYADRRGTRIVALTDCPRSLIASFSHAIIVPTQAPRALPMLAPAVASVEIIASLMVDSEAPPRAA